MITGVLLRHQSSSGGSGGSGGDGGGGALGGGGLEDECGDRGRWLCGSETLALVFVKGGGDRVRTLIWGIVP